MKAHEDYPLATTEPDWPTTRRGLTRDGRLRGADNSLWVYRKVPMGPVDDAKTTAQMLETAEPLGAALNGIATLSKVNSLLARRANKSAYRPFHLLLVNVPGAYTPPEGHVRYAELMDDYGDKLIKNRVLFLGTPVFARVGAGRGIKSAVSSVWETFAYSAVPLEDFAHETRKVNAIFDQANLHKLTTRDHALLNGWFNFGNNADVHMVPEADVLHLMPSATATKIIAGELRESRPSSQWPEIPGHHSLSFASVAALNIQWAQASDYSAQWATQLVNAGAAAISIRGLVEPGVITDKMLSKARQHKADKIFERSTRGKVSRDQDAISQEQLNAIQGVYSQANPPATLIDTSITVAFDDNVQVEGKSTGAVVLTPMINRQMLAMTETWPCSHVRMNPSLHELPISAVSYSGLPALSTVGDQHARSAMTGWTEMDRQPAYVWPMREVYDHSAVISVILGATGSGKTVFSMNLAHQFASCGYPTIVVQPKSGEDQSEAVEALGGTVINLDDLLQTSGIFDPLRFSKNPSDGAALAASVLSTTNPFGSAEDLSRIEGDLLIALTYGAEAGAASTGHALRLARDAGHIRSDVVERVLKMSARYPLFAAVVGNQESRSGSLSVGDGLTLIQAGSTYLDIPESTANPTLPQRITISLLRMMMVGTARSVAYREGIVLFDEGHVVLGAGRDEFERLGRTIRSMKVKVYLMTQRVTDTFAANITDLLGSSFILSMNNKEEAMAACDMLHLEKTAERVKRLYVKATVGRPVPGQPQKPNWDSMRPLFEVDEYGHEELVRGSVAIFADTSGNATYTELVIPPSFLEMVSTDPDAVDRRQARRAAKAEAAAKLAEELAAEVPVNFEEPAAV